MLPSFGMISTAALLHTQRHLGYWLWAWLIKYISGLKAMEWIIPPFRICTPQIM